MPAPDISWSKQETNLDGALVTTCRPICTGFRYSVRRFQNGSARACTAVSSHSARYSLPASNNIVVPSTSQKSAIRPPFETAYLIINTAPPSMKTTHLKSMSLQFHDLVLLHPHVMMPYTPVFTSRRQGMLGPAQARYSSRVTAHRSYPLPHANVPNLDIACIQTDRERAVRCE